MLYFKLGYWIKNKANGLIIAGFVSHGFGNADIYRGLEGEQGQIASFKGSNLELGARLIKTLKFNMFKFDYYLGGSLYLFDYRENEINNIPFDSSAWNLLIHVGIGFGF